MDRLVLTQTVRIEGRDFFGRHSLLMISPNPAQNGWVWSLNGIDIPITPDIMESKPRRVALVRGEYELNEFEHIGILRAAGLEHVRIWTSLKKGWPPYFGGAFQIWQAVMPHVVKSGELKPYSVPYAHKKEGFPTCCRLPNAPDRWSSYMAFSNSEARKALHVSAQVHFPTIARDRRAAVYDSSEIDVLKFVKARTLGWPPSLYYLSRLAYMLGWPHHPRILWKQEVDGEKLLDEAAQHRVLDMLGVLNFLAPPDTYLTGLFNSHKGNHQTDIMLLQELAAAKVVSLRQRVA